MHKKTHVLFMEIPVKVIYPLCVERGRPALNTVYLIPFSQKKFSKIGPILACDSGYQSSFHGLFLILLDVRLVLESGNSNFDCGILSQKIDDRSRGLKDVRYLEILFQSL